MKRLTEECHGLRRDFQRQEALVSQKEEVIAKLRDEACTLWAFGWLAFRHKATKVFPGLDLNFQVPTEGEAKEFDSDDEADPVIESCCDSSTWGSVDNPSTCEIHVTIECLNATR